MCRLCVSAQPRVGLTFMPALRDGSTVFDTWPHQQLFALAWLALGRDPAARSHSVEQFTAL
jgi:hypothetical protein